MVCAEILTTTITNDKANPSKFKHMHGILHSYSFVGAMIVVFNDDEFLKLGLQMAGHCERTINRSKAATNLSRFTAKYCAGPDACADTFLDIQTTMIEEAQVDNPNQRHLLIALNWLKEYPVEENLAGTAKSTKS